MDYGACLVGLVVAGAALRERRLFLGALVLLANNLAVSAYYRATGDQYDWSLNAAVDYASAAALVALGARGRGGALLVLTYAVAMLWHARYALGEQDDWARYHYWYQTSYTAWAQAALVAIGGGIDGGRRVVDAGRSVAGRLGELRWGLGARGLGAGRAALHRARRRPPGQAD